MSGSPKTDPILRVQDLNVEFSTPRGIVHAVRGVSFDLMPGETIGIVGESGSGKSVTARAVMRLLPVPPARIASGRVIFDGKDLLSISKAEMRTHRGSDIAMVYQDPLRALNPTMRLGDQIVEAITAHERGLERSAIRKRVLDLLDRVRIPDATAKFSAYPHELSGGMRQRVVIAMALAARPRVLIADEPTSALDVTVQAQILDLLSELQAELQMAMILVTHDLGVAAMDTHRVLVMYHGRIVEKSPTEEIFDAMRMPYTRALFDSIPRLDSPPHEPIPTVEGRPPEGVEHTRGCSFSPRCRHGDELCFTAEPPLTSGAEPPHSAEHEWACWHPLETPSPNTRARVPASGLQL